MLLDIRGRRFLRLINHVRLGLPQDHRFIEHHFFRVGSRRQVVHRVEQHAFQNRAKTSRPGLALHRSFRHGTKRIVAELEFDAFHVEQLTVLFGQRILGLYQDADECVFIEFLERRHHRQPADELRNQAVANQVFRLHVLQQFADALLFLARLDFGDEADAALRRATQNYFLEASKCTATDKENVTGIDLQELLLRVFSAALRRHRSDGSLNQLE